MIQAKPSKDLRNNYPEISRLVKEGNQIIITVNGVGDGAYISMDDFNELIQSRQNSSLIRKAAARVALADSPEAEWIAHEDVMKQFGYDA